MVLFLALLCTHFSGALNFVVVKKEAVPIHITKTQYIHKGVQFYFENDKIRDNEMNGVKVTLEI